MILISRALFVTPSTMFIWSSSFVVAAIANLAGKHTRTRLHSEKVAKQK